MTMTNLGMILSIALGGAIGSVARYFLSSQVTHAVGPGFPWGILVVNILGCFLMGVIVEVAALVWSMAPEMRAFLTTGILGGFTTFSAFGLDTAVLIERGDPLGAALYVLSSVAFSIAALFIGLALVRWASS